jgi:uncharacterized membrane protein
MVETYKVTTIIRLFQSAPKKYKDIYIPMFIQKWIQQLIVSAMIMLSLVYVYLSIFQKAYADQIANIQRVVMQVNVEGVIICYIALILGLNYFIIRNRRPVLDAFLFGLIIYTVYDSTNYAVIKKWSPYLATIDAIWGGILMAVTTQLTYFIVN